jgi:hypothetical protein
MTFSAGPVVFTSTARLGAQWKARSSHGLYSRKATERRAEARRLRKELAILIASL